MTPRDYQPGEGPARGIVVALLSVALIAAVVALVAWIARLT